MRRRTFIASMVAAYLVAANVGAAVAGDSGVPEVRAGASLHIKPNSIWFQTSDKLAEWQRLRAGGDAAALDAYQEEALTARVAWQFTAELAVKVLSAEPETHQIHVEMQTPGRMLGTKWFVDASAGEK